MNKNTLLLLTLTGLLSQAAFSQAGQPTLQTVEIFSLPGANYGPYAQGLNGHEEVVGYTEQSDGTVVGFARFRSERTTLLSFPGASGTYAQDVNSGGTVCGDYFDHGGIEHGWLLTGDGYSSFDVSAATTTAIFGINDAGDFVGLYNDNGNAMAFLDQAGVVSNIDVGGVTTYATGISSNGNVVGTYRQASTSRYRGFLRYADNTLLRNIDVPRSVVPGTFCQGVNKNGVVVGYAPMQFDTEGFVFKAPHTYITYAVNGADATYLTGITDNGFVTGYYLDTQGNAHGLILRLVED